MPLRKKNKIKSNYTVIRIYLYYFISHLYYFSNRRYIMLFLDRLLIFLKINSLNYLTIIFLMLTKNYLSYSQQLLKDSILSPKQV